MHVTSNSSGDKGSCVQGMRREKRSVVLAVNGLADATDAARFCVGKKRPVRDKEWDCNLS